MARIRKNIGTIFDIIKYAVHDGPGIRTTVFLKGCPLTCWWCQNPESQNTEPERIAGVEGHKYSALFYGEDKGLIGREVTVEQVMTEVEKDKIFYEYSGGGITLSGGEPLMQPNFLLGLLKTSRKRGIHTALDTSGYAPWSVFRHVIEYTDLFLYDLKIMDDRRHQKYTGVSNKLILDNLLKLLSRKARVFLRFPVISGITDKKENIDAIGGFIRRLKGIAELNLLPHNYLCKDKYRRMKKDYACEHVEPLSDVALQKIKQRFETFGVLVKIRG